jgi:hypothetical protein
LKFQFQNPAAIKNHFKKRQVIAVFNYASRQKGTDGGGIWLDQLLPSALDGG